MTKPHKVRPGDCFSSIAFSFGFAVETLWNHPDNRALREKRGSPYLLLPGDVVAIPALREKQVACTTGALHRFRRRDVPERLKVRLTDAKGLPRSNQKYVLYVDQQPVEGVTDSDGRIQHSIAPDAQQARRVIGDEEYELHIGHLAPVDEDAGARARLAALGYLEEDADANESQSSTHRLCAHSNSMQSSSPSGASTSLRGNDSSKPSGLRAVPESDRTFGCLPLLAVWNWLKLAQE